MTTYIVDPLKLIGKEPRLMTTDESLKWELECQKAYMKASRDPDRIAGHAHRINEIERYFEEKRIKNVIEMEKEKSPAPIIPPSIEVKPYIQMESNSKELPELTKEDPDNKAKARRNRKKATEEVNDTTPIIEGDDL